MCHTRVYPSRVSNNYQKKECTVVLYQTISITYHRILLTFIIYKFPFCFFSDQECTYNDPQAASYMGHKTTTESGYICASWGLQQSYPVSHFPDGSLEGANNNCRNPKPTDHKAWCYYRFTGKRKWDYCELNPCRKYGWGGKYIPWNMRTAKKLYEFTKAVDITTTKHKYCALLCSYQRL